MAIAANTVTLADYAMMSNAPLVQAVTFSLNHKTLFWIIQGSVDIFFWVSALFSIQQRSYI